jgi:broad-specificity NMP kinase
MVLSIPAVPTNEARVFWICGAAGAGKSVAAWTLYGRLAARGVRVAYVDIDQLGMFYPEREDDPGRHVLKTDALARLLPGYTAHGAQVVVVSGVVDSGRGPGDALSAVADVTLVALTPDARALRERILARGWDPEDAEEAVDEGRGLRTSAFVDMVIDTARLSVTATVDRLLPAVRFDSDRHRGREHMRSSSATVGVVAVTGPRAAGSSTVGYGFAHRRWQAGISGS